LKIAILSDIHANFDAFNAILQDDSFLECDVYVNAGDSIGYFHHPLEVVSNLISYKFLSVRGNHEDMLIKAEENDVFLKSITESYGLGHQIALNRLENDHLQYLRDLPDFQKIKSSEGNVFIYHGSPSKNTDYLYPDFSENVNTLEIPEDCLWLILGNTHWPMLRHVNGTIIINPGSVGQPRNGIEGAHWAILNTVNGDVTFKIKEYK
jgi:putative phosphoesterase